MTPSATLAKAQAAAARTALEDRLAQQLRAAKIEFAREVVFHPKRKWRFDFTVGSRLAIEVEGGTRGTSRHTTGAGFETDAIKYAEALCLGWRVLRVTGTQVKSGQALAWVERLLA